MRVCLVSVDRLVQVCVCLKSKDRGLPGMTHPGGWSVLAAHYV